MELGPLVATILIVERSGALGLSGVCADILLSSCSSVMSSRIWSKSGLLGWELLVQVFCLRLSCSPLLILSIEGVWIGIAASSRITASVVGGLVGVGVVEGIRLGIRVLGSRVFFILALILSSSGM